MSIPPPYSGYAKRQPQKYPNSKAASFSKEPVAENGSASANGNSNGNARNRQHANKPLNKREPYQNKQGSAKFNGRSARGETPRRAIDAKTTGVSSKQPDHRLHRSPQTAQKQSENGTTSPRISGDHSVSKPHALSTTAKAEEKLCASSTDGLSDLSAYKSDCESEPATQAQKHPLSMSVSKPNIPMQAEAPRKATTGSQSESPRPETLESETRSESSSDVHSEDTISEPKQVAPAAQNSNANPFPDHTPPFHKQAFVRPASPDQINCKTSRIVSQVWCAIFENQRLKIENEKLRIHNEKIIMDNEKLIISLLEHITVELLQAPST